MPRWNNNTPHDYPVTEGDPRAIAKREVVRPIPTPNESKASGCSCGRCSCGFERMKRQNRELARGR